MCECLCLFGVRYANDGSRPPVWTSRDVFTTAAGASEVHAVDVNRCVGAARMSLTFVIKFENTTHAFAPHSSAIQAKSRLAPTFQHFVLSDITGPAREVTLTQVFTSFMTEYPCIRGCAGYRHL